MLPGRPVAFKLLCDRTGGNIAGVFEEVVPPGIGTALHVHRTSRREVIYILAGRIHCAARRESSKPVSAGAWIFIPRGTVHGWRNSGRENGRASSSSRQATAPSMLKSSGFRDDFGPDIDPAIRDELRQRHGFEFVARDWDD